MKNLAVAESETRDVRRISATPPRLKQTASRGGKFGACPSGFADRLPRSLLLSLLALTAVGLLSAADRREIDIPADTPWTETAIDVKPGDVLLFSATGTLDFSGATSTPDGLARGWKDLIAQLPLNTSGRGALIGRWGQSVAARAFLIGAESQHTAPIAGRLFLGINQPATNTATGSYHVIIQRTAAPASAPAAIRLPRFTQALLDAIPLRVNDAQDNPGDRVNFILIGSESQVQAALQSAGWVVVDKTKKEAVLHGLMVSLSKDAYVTLPMSELQLFGRVQDYGYAQGDPLRVVASRHHFRLWRCPFLADGQTVWAGAGTHDTGFDKDARNNGITHKIDPATDGERDYIGESLQQTGTVAKEEYLTPTQPIKDGRTATGSGFTSDGRTLVIFLRPGDKS